MNEKKDITEYSDDDLMQIIHRERDKDDDLAQRAFTVIYQKYAQALFTICSKVCGARIETDLIYEKVWKRVYDYPKYSSSKNNCKFITWLNRIAVNAWKDIQQKIFLCDYLPPEKLPEMEAPDEPEEERLPSIEEITLRKSLTMLTDKERDILLTYMQYESNDNKQLPRNILEQLKTKYNTTSANIRQIKFRSLKKVKDFIEKMDE